MALLSIKLRTAGSDHVYGWRRVCTFAVFSRRVVPSGLNSVITNGEYSSGQQEGIRDPRLELGHIIVFFDQKLYNRVSGIRLSVVSPTRLYVQLV